MSLTECRKDSIMIIDINDVFKSVGMKEVKKFQTGSELLLALEMSKVLQSMKGDIITIEGCTIDKALIGREYFNHCVREGLAVNAEYAEMAGSEVNQSFFSKDIRDVKFLSQTDEVWEYAHKASDFTNRVIMKEEVRGGKAYVALMAYVIIYNYINNKRVKLLINQGNVQEFEYDELIILKNYGNKLLESDDVLELHFDDKYAEWEAYRVLHMQRGMMCREYSANEKYKACKKLYEVGDIVLRYEKKKGGKTTNNPKLASCYPAVIKGISTKGLELAYYPLIETKLTRLRNIEKARSDMYNIVDKETFTVCNETLEWRSVGIGGMTFDEKVFITDVMTDDGTYQVLSDGEKEELVFLNTAETIYAVFRDRGVECNIQKFKKTFFSGRTPKYDEYRVRMEMNK